MRRKLRQTLSQTAEPTADLQAYNSFDIVGDIAITKLPDPSPANAQAIAQAIMRRHKKVKTVFAQTSGVAGNYRLRKLQHLAGENGTYTVHKESGCLFNVDVETCYFSPRLSHERIRIAELVQPSEIVVNMFAGVGCFSILIAKHQSTAKVYSIDINPAAIRFMQENIRLNRVYGKVVPVLGDAVTLTKDRFMGCADRVLMPLPEKALEYLPCAVSSLKPSGGWIHLHLFEHAAKNEDSAEKVKAKVADAFSSLRVVSDLASVHVVRSTGPHWFQLVADVWVKQQ